MGRLSVIWLSPLSDYNKVLMTNQFALPALTYFTWTQVWTISDLQRLDRETRKVMVVNGAKHPLSSTDLLYLPRKFVPTNSDPQSHTLSSRLPSHTQIATSSLADLIAHMVYE